ncbi:IclR family transcriptional regulator [Roseovarius atlanticus]|uniref:IclR family transcriptional regulator n=1 Tax=Roseovarius atlanticus TaxID=1641875 RepID=UPI0021BD8E0C|nr:IclR family transcriptional regulator [Roseovarius atlanticus]
MGSNALLKALHVLETFQNDTGALSVQDMADQTRQTKSSAQRSAYTLEKLGYLERYDDGVRYVPGRSCLGPAYGFLQNNQLVEAATPFLLDLSEKVGIRAHLSVLEGTDVIYLSRIPSQEERLTLSPLGKRWPAISASSGRAILAALPADERDRIIAASRLKKITPQTLVDLPAILQAIRQAGTDGYAFQREEVLPGVASVSSAVVAPDGQVHGAVILSGPVAVFDAAEDRQRLGQAVIQATRAIGACNLS